MTVISKLTDDPLVVIPKMLAKIEAKISEWPRDMEIDGKNIQTALVEHASLVAYYDQISVDAYSLVQYSDMLVKKIRAEKMRFIKENSSRDYTDSAIQKAIDGDSDYIKYQVCYLNANEVYERCKSIVSAFSQRSYRLKDLVVIYQNELQDITIHI